MHVLNLQKLILTYLIRYMRSRERGVNGWNWNEQQQDSDMMYFLAQYHAVNIDYFSAFRF